MKKNLGLTLLVLMILSGSVIAQSRLYFGASGTLLSTWTTNQNNYGRPEMDYKFTFNPAGNVNIGYDFNKSIGLTFQPGYAVLGQRYGDERNDTTFARRVSMGYVVLPLMFRYRTSGEIARFYAMAGPQFNLLIKAKQEYFANDVTTDDEVYNPNLDDYVKIGEEDITDRYVPYDIMARIDFGVEVNLMDNLFLTAGISMAYGLMDLNDPDWRLDDSSGNYTPSHNTYGGFTVGINYCFNPKKDK